jgi:hypothetical protein
MALPRRNRSNRIPVTCDDSGSMTNSARRQSGVATVLFLRTAPRTVVALLCQGAAFDSDLNCPALCTTKQKSKIDNPRSSRCLFFPSNSARRQSGVATVPFLRATSRTVVALLCQGAAFDSDLNCPALRTTKQKSKIDNPRSSRCLFFPSNSARRQSGVATVPFLRATSRTVVALLCQGAAFDSDLNCPVLYPTKQNSRISNSRSSRCLFFPSNSARRQSGVATVRFLRAAPSTVVAPLCRGAAFDSDLNCPALYPTKQNSRISNFRSSRCLFFPSNSARRQSGVATVLFLRTASRTVVALLCRGAAFDFDLCTSSEVMIASPL